MKKAPEEDADAQQACVRCEEGYLAGENRCCDCPDGQARRRRVGAARKREQADKQAKAEYQKPFPGAFGDMVKRELSPAMAARASAESRDLRGWVGQLTQEHVDQIAASLFESDAAVAKLAQKYQGRPRDLLALLAPRAFDAFHKLGLGTKR